MMSAADAKGIALNSRMEDTLEGMWNRAVVAYFKSTTPAFAWKYCGKKSRNISCIGRGWNQASPEGKPEVLSLEPISSTLGTITGNMKTTKTNSPNILWHIKHVKCDTERQNLFSRRPCMSIFVIT